MTIIYPEGKPWDLHVTASAGSAVETDTITGLDDHPIVVSNHSGYDMEGSANFEHDDNGCLHNYSGVEDDVFSAFADNDGW